MYYAYTLMHMHIKFAHVHMYLKAQERGIVTFPPSFSYICLIIKGGSVKQSVVNEKKKINFKY